MKTYVGEVIQKINMSGIEVMREIGYFAYYLENIGDIGWKNWYNSQGEWSPYGSSNKNIQLNAKIYKNKDLVHVDLKVEPCKCGQKPIEAIFWVDPQQVTAPNGIHWTGSVCLDCMVIVPDEKMGTSISPVRVEIGHPIRGGIKDFDESQFQTNVGQTRDKYPFIRGLPKPEMKND